MLVLCATSAAAASRWTQVLEHAPWTPRSDTQLAHLDGKLLLMGGHANNDYSNDVWASADGGGTWQQQPTPPWEPRSYHTAKVVNGALLLLAGHDASTWYSDVWRTTNGRNWTLVTRAAAFGPRAATALQARGDALYVMGGSDGLLAPIGNGTCFNDVWKSVDGGASWRLVSAAAPWAAREGLQKLTALYGADDTIVLTAGEAGYFGPYYHDVWGLAADDTWTRLNPAADFSARSGNLLLNYGGALFTFGGYGVPMKHDAYCLAAGNASARWVRLPDAPWKGRYDYDMEIVGDAIVLVGGEASLFGAGGPYFNDVWRLESPMCDAGSA
jgi:hypothetical protein